MDPENLGKATLEIGEPVYHHCGWGLRLQHMVGLIINYNQYARLGRFRPNGSLRLSSVRSTRVQDQD